MLDPDTRLGHYRIIGLLGRGGMADVYRAEDERLGRAVALKALPPEFARDPERVKRFEREVRAAAKLTHSGIVTVYEYGQGAGQHFYTMALMPGGDLKARIRRHPDGMPPAQARGIAAAIARALAYAHGRGYVHRDVKPENILFDAADAPQLTDFGIARAISEGTRMTATGTSIGSPYYMSPEQARGLDVDGRSDLYSLGVVLYEMLAGRVPFDASDTFAVGLSHINDPVPALPDALSAYQPVLDRLLAKSPDDRYADAAELAAVLASDSPPSAEPRTQQMPAAQPAIPAPPKVPRGMAAALTGAALAVALAALGYFALRGLDAPVRPLPAGGASPPRISTTPAREPMNPLDLLDEAPSLPPLSEPVRAGARFRDALSSGGAGPEMVVIPPGSFRMGCISGQDCYDDEKPVRTVRFGAPFALSRTEVTFTQWSACIADRGCGGSRPADEGWGRGDRPVIHVSWEDAREYASWLSRRTGESYRLPSEAEWEYAARAGASTKYHWGDGVGRNRANCRGCGSRWDGKGTAPAGSFAANAWGLHDMHGNVWEWTRDCWNDSYRRAPTDGMAWLSGNCSRRVLRGGSWFSNRRGLRAAIRISNDITYRSRINGFRVLRRVSRTLSP